jgi:hypothetical protein
MGDCPQKFWIIQERRRDRDRNFAYTNVDYTWSYSSVMLYDLRETIFFQMVENEEASFL